MNGDFLCFAAAGNRLATILMSDLAAQGSNLQKETCMSPDVHLAELKAIHRALEDEISDALAHPSTDDIKIAELKRRKLQVKDEIARLQHEVNASIH
jgi:hypothetical protein